MAIVDDHQLVVEGLVSLLTDQEGLRIAGTASTVEEALDLAAREIPDVVVMDFRLPDGDGTVAARRIRERWPQVAVLFLSADPSEDAVIKAVDAGACGYVAKDASSGELVISIARAARGEFLLPASIVSRLGIRREELARRERRKREFTAREREILELMGMGLDNQQIAGRLGIAYATVRTHVRNLLEKLDSRSRLQAVVAGRNLHLID